MKILQVNKFHHNYGGDNRYYIELSRILTDSGHDIIPFSMKYDGNVPTPFSEHFVDNIDFKEISGLPAQVRSFFRAVYSFDSRKKIEYIVDRYKPEIAHLHNIYHHLTPSILPGIKKYGIPTVMTAHDYKLVCPSYSLFDGSKVCERCKGGEKIYNVVLTRCHKGSFMSGFALAVEAYLHKYLKTYAKHLDMIITPSKFMKDIFTRFHIPSSKIAFVPNFVDPIPDEFNRGEEGYILYFGRLSIEKGVITLVKAMKQFSGYRLIIAGEGPERNNLEETCSREGISNIEFVGQKSPVEIQELIENSFFTVIPSVGYENCPLTVLESMARGKPVIGARIGGIPDLIREGEDGLLFEAGDEMDLCEKIERMMKDREYRHSLGENGHRKVKKHYNKEVHYGEVISIYNKLLGIGESSHQSLPTH